MMNIETQRTAGITASVIEEYCRTFLRNPYWCYTEHGIHAQFYTMLLSELPVGEVNYSGQQVCRVQKEYPTAAKLKKSRRQHWDIAVLDVAADPVPGKHPAYDHLKLDCVVEFGLNEKPEHLEDDIRRVSHPESATANAFVVHLYRLSWPLFSKRDRSDRSTAILSAQVIQDLLLKNQHPDSVVPVSIYLARADRIDRRNSGIWRINTQGTTPLQVE